MTAKENLEKVLNSLGWSKNRLAREIYMEINDIEDEDEILRFEERVKKEFQRSTTKQERFEYYLEIISHHREFKKLDLVVPNHKSSNILSESLAKGLSEISRELSNELLK